MHGYESFSDLIEGGCRLSKECCDLGMLRDNDGGAWSTSESVKLWYGVKAYGSQQLSRPVRRLREAGADIGNLGERCRVDKQVSTSHGREGRVFSGKRIWSL